MKLPLKLLSVFIIFSALFTGCPEDKPLADSPVVFEKILRSVSYKKGRPVSKLVELVDPDKSYYLALKANTIGRMDAALLLGRHSWENSSGLIRERAAELSINITREMKAWADVEFLASIASGDFPDIYFFRRAAVEAVYRQEKFSRLAEGIDILRAFPEASDDYELYLFEAVSAYSRNEEGWEEKWIDFFTRTPPSEYIRRGWNFITASEEEPTLLFSSIMDLIEGKYLASTGYYREALPYFEVWLDETAAAGLFNAETGAIAGELEQLYINTGNSLRGARFFETFDERAGEHLFAAARLFRRAGYYRDALRCMNNILEADSDQLTDRLLWYWFDLLVKTDMVSASNELTFLIENWSEPDYFSDVLDRLCTTLVRRRKWELISEASKMLQLSGPEDASDRFRYITSRAAELGLVDYHTASGPYSTLYYRILTGDSLKELESPESPGFDSTMFNEHELFLKGFIDFELYDRILPEVRLIRERLSEGFLIYVAESLTERGFYLDSIRIMYQYQGQLTAEGLMSLYPPVYQEEIGYAADANGIPKQLLSAIVWKESGFERDIVSRAGAVGLSQLMPSTADDVAARMGMAAGDLTAPEHNLMLGSWYLNWLNGYVGSPAEAVLSYNGGPGRVKGWRREYPDLPEDLFYETVPIPETHDYGKRVLTAAVVYGMFYYGIEPAQTLKTIFQEI